LRWLFFVDESRLRNRLVQQHEGIAEMCQKLTEKQSAIVASKCI
jgi:hypothetical protein